LAGVRAVLGDGIRLNRYDEVRSILKSVEEHPATIVIGESGCGKSALVKQVATTESRFGHIVWLAPAQLSKASQNEIAVSNGLRHNLTRLIGASSRSASLLVIDAFEKFEGEASLRLDELLRALRDECFTGWKLIVTGQPQSWAGVERTMVGQGVTDFVKIEVDTPPLPEVRHAVQHLPGIGALFLRTELQPILRNLMVLDWVLRTDVGQRLSKDPRTRIGETDLINSIWEHWISKNRRLERDRLLRKLGLHEGERLSGAVSIDSVDQTELTLLEDLSREGLLRIHLPSVRFSHDLIGDWARFRVLAGEGDGAITKIKSVIQIPRWNRAVRLFAQSLVEGKQDLVDWQKATAALDTADPESKLARDLFLEATVFAANSTSLLEALWPNLLTSA
jgi:ABC-type oligopeptide transport system ATPase subunit